MIPWSLFFERMEVGRTMAAATALLRTISA
jgi:hypothetical protein